MVGKIEMKGDRDMSTNCDIAQKTDDGKVRVIYSHWDGYPQYVGKMLLEHYNVQEKIEALLNFGDMSILEATPEGSTFYHRDRGEEWEDVQPRIFDDEKSFLSRRDINEWNYLFKDGQWFVCFGKELVPLSKVIEDDE